MNYYKCHSLFLSVCFYPWFLSLFVCGKLLLTLDNFFFKHFICYYRDLEDQRTRTSLSLTEEKLLLKKISAAEKDKRQLQECLDFDKKVNTKKVC